MGRAGRAPRRGAAGLTRILLTLLLLSGLAWAQDDLQWFGPADHSFRVSVPGDVRALENGPQRYLWGCSRGVAQYLFGYAELPRAAELQGNDLRQALGQFTTSYLASAGVREKARQNLTVGGCPALEASGSGRHGSEWVWVLAVGPRVFLASAGGTSESEARRFWSSFAVSP